ncbi:MAG: NTP transferase domain-containing protein [Alphaproteobacteria bacterium]|nr:NTP transferase domain-containing protein [Alphaproteobacteria bacterium]
MISAPEEGALPPIVLLAGGLASRMGALTQARPKSLLEVAGEPFIAHQLRYFAAEGFPDVVICAGHLGGQIEDFVGDGRRFGCQVRYSWDGAVRLGTGGAIRQALPLLGRHFLVMYGDSYLPIRFRPVWEAFLRAAAVALMTVFRNERRWDNSNVEFADGVIRVYDKVHRTEAMQHIDYGLGVLDASVFSSIEAGRPFDLAELYAALVGEGRLMGYEVEQRFYEIGSVAGLAETDEFLRARLHCEVSR